MPLRASLENIRALLTDADADVWVPLTMANEMVDELLASSDLSTTILKHIETYLACHLYAQGTPDIVRETYAGATFEYPKMTNNAEGLCSTKWGQMAIALDSTGTLKTLGLKRAEIHLI